MTLYFRRRLLFRVLALLMMFLILALASVVPIMQASALAPVIAYGAKELVAALLIAGGASFATSDEVREAATKVWDWLGQQASGVADKLQQIVALQIDVANTVGNGAVRISSDVFSAISDAFKALFSDSSGSSLDVFEYGRQYNALYVEDFYKLCTGIFSLDSAQNYPIHAVCNVDSDGIPHTYTVFTDESGGMVRLWLCYTQVDGTVEYERIKSSGSPFYRYGMFANMPYSVSTNYTEIGIWYQLKADSPVEDYIVSAGAVRPFRIGYFTFSSDTAIPSPDLTYPGEDTMIYVPDIPEVQTDEEGKDVVIWPDLSLNPDDFVLDIPKTATGDLVDVPYDTLVDASTGTAVGEGEGTGTGEGEGTGSGILDILGDIWDAIRNFFDSPSDFKLDFDGFKNLILVDRFPFCIPFDLRDAIMLFAASAADYKFSIDLDTSYFSVHHTVDLSPYTVPITFFRYVVVVWFVYVLILRTRDVMKW